MKKRKLIEQLNDNIKFFRCPICKKSVQISNDRSFICDQQHCFDVSSKGYTNFITAKGIHKNKYDKNLFECRNQIFSVGFYDPVIKQIEMIIHSYCSNKIKVNILDVGCGEGFYATALDNNEQYNVFALDNVKEAVQIACRVPTNVKWMVANLANIPMCDNSVDVLLNILTPANYEEFLRLLTPDGILLKIIPGKHYLQEIRDSIYEHLNQKNYTNDATISYFKEHIDLIQTREIKYTVPVTKKELQLFLQMTPMTFHIDTASIDYKNINEITIHLEVLLGKGIKK